MRKLLLAFCAIIALTACNKESEQEAVTPDRTVLIYMAAENNLTQWISNPTFFADEDLQQIKEGVKTIGNNRLAVYVDKAQTSVHKGTATPYLLYFSNGQLTDSIPMEESLTADPAVLERVARKAFGDNPASSYGLVLWGHGTGWSIKNDSVAYNSMARRKAYGGDTGNDTHTSAGKYWMNIPSMAKALSHVPHLDFIFCDCCHMACVEIAYELRGVTDYLIGSPAEIPGVGAPYQEVVPAMMEKTTFWKSIVDYYFEQYADGISLPLAVIKTSEMGALATATATALKASAESINATQYPDVSGLIHYYHEKSSQVNTYYDMNDFMLRHASTNDYQAWKQAFDRAVVYKKMASEWMTNIVPYYGSWSKFYGDFEMTEQRFGGITMFIPQYYSRYTENTTIKQMGWYYAAGYEAIGW